MKSSGNFQGDLQWTYLADAHDIVEWCVSLKSILPSCWQLFVIISNNWSDLFSDSESWKNDPKSQVSTSHMVSDWFLEPSTFSSR